MTSLNGNMSSLLALCVANSPVTGEFPPQRPLNRSFDVFFDLRLDKRLSTQPRSWLVIWDAITLINTTLQRYVLVLYKPCKTKYKPVFYLRLYFIEKSTKRNLHSDGLISGVRNVYCKRTNISFQFSCSLSEGCMVILYFVSIFSF